MTHTVVVVDKTGRGHSICAALVANSRTVKVHYLPGTGGILGERIARAPRIDDFRSVIAACEDLRPDLVFVSHIEALDDGIADELRQRGFRVFGASSKAARLESSKWFCKEVCRENGVPTPRARLFEDRAALGAFLSDPSNLPKMVKVDWLTRNGNGAIPVPAGTRPQDVLAQIDAVIAQNPGAPFKVLAEDYLPGVDYSAHYFVQGRSIVELPSAQDFKKSHDADGGANCDGMGSLSPHMMDSPALSQTIANSILKPVLKGLRARGISYSGPIYLGLRIDADGRPHLLEINTRLGDSESQTIFPRVDEDLFALLMRMTSGERVERRLKVKPRSCVTITLSAGAKSALKDQAELDRETDWPFRDIGSGEIVRFFPALLADKAMVFWAGVEQSADSSLRTRAGRVAHISALGGSIREARDRVYASIQSVCFQGKRWRTDIGA
ncbi:hypothetical protein LC092_17220 [Stappia stellulata]|uniref:phosphoribosylamine--glycine ligase n=1 Tax=Stappia stellulata TaxID=71235 RepID=UPI001CD7FF4F|nr:phosphoribosylglycinamide synthetase C domain-containing protein [Stappia stellulata]MCA1244189.1 hypothetical protein [Stappia stellulata]